MDLEALMNQKSPPRVKKRPAMAPEVICVDSDNEVGGMKLPQPQATNVFKSK